MEQVTDEVTLEGDPAAFREGTLLAEDILGVETWTFDISGTPNGVKALRATLELTGAADGAAKLPIPFEFIDELEYYIMSKVPSSSLPEIRLAWLSKLTAGPVLELSVNQDVDLFPYARDGFELRGVMTGRVPEADTAFIVRVVVLVDVF